MSAVATPLAAAAETQDVIVCVEGRVGRLILNRPKALHALTREMCQRMVEALLLWRDDPSVEMIVIDHAGERGFCAGGDIRMLAASGATDAVEARAFFFIEYRLNALLMAYPKPILAFMDGVVMGGGLGLALPCRWRIATERTVLAMPETGIGLFPDVGGGWHLPRLAGESGLWLALTGARVKAADGLALGLGTHYVPSTGLGALKAALIDRPQAAQDLIDGAAQDPGPGQFAPERARIDAAFAAPSVEAVLQALREDGSDFARAQHDLLLTKSPQTLKVAFRQLRIGRGLTSFEENMAMEYRIGSRVVRRHDFREGVRALIIDKDNRPVWSPARLEDIDEALLDEIFAPLPPDEEWTALESAP